MEDSPKTQKVLRTVSCIVLVAYAVVLIGIPLIREGVRLYNINQKDYYVLFDEYNYSLNRYDVYVMINNRGGVSERDAIEAIMTDAFVYEMQNVPSNNPMYDNLYEKCGRHEIKVYLLLPTDRLHYGWEKSYETIEYNMADTGIDFYDIRDSINAMLTIPLDATKFADCTIEF